MTSNDFTVKIPTGFQQSGDERGDLRIQHEHITFHLDSVFYLLRTTLTSYEHMEMNEQQKTYNYNRFRDALEMMCNYGEGLTEALQVVEGKLSREVKEND